MAVALAGTARAQDPSQGTLYALLSANPGAAANAAIEIVELSIPSSAVTFGIGYRDVTSLAVSRDRTRLYVADRAAAAVAVYSTSGALITSIAVGGAPEDLVIAPDGATLYVATNTSIVAIATATNVAKLPLSTGTSTLSGMALSPDATILGAAGTYEASTPTGLQLKPALYLIDVRTLSVLARVPLTGPLTTACLQIAPTDVAFTNTGRVLLWDGRCNSLYQVDVATRTQLTDQTINVGPVTTPPTNVNNMVSYSQARSRAYSLAPGLFGLVELDPTALSSSTFTGFSLTPTVPALTRDGSAVYTAVVPGGPLTYASDTLDRFDSASGIFTRGIQAFYPGMRVRDLRFLPFNHPPTAVARVANTDPDGTNPVGPTCVATVKLDGTGSTEPDGDVLTYKWTASFGTITGATASASLPRGTFPATLTVNDGVATGAPATVSVVVVDKTAPVFTSVPAPITVPTRDHKTFASVKVDYATATDNCGAPHRPVQCPGGRDCDGDLIDVVHGDLSRRDQDRHLHRDGCRFEYCHCDNDRDGGDEIASHRPDCQP